MKRLTKLILGLSLITLGACGSIVDLPGSGEPPQIYRLTAAENIETDRVSNGLRILVDEPTASRALDTDRIALRPSPVELSYFASAKWSDRAPRLVQDLLIDSLTNSGVVEYAGRGPTGMKAKYLISGQLSEFEAVYDSGPPLIEVTLRLNLVEQKNANILASKTFAAEARAKRNNNKSVIMAFNEAFVGVLNEASVWALETLP